MTDLCILPNIIDAQAQKYGQREALALVNENGDKLAAYSYEQLQHAVDQYACALLALGLEPGQICLIFSANRPEMLITDFACYSIGAVPVSIYATSSADQLAYISKHCRPRFAFTGDAKQQAEVEQILPSSPWIEKTFNWDAGQSPADLFSPGELAALLPRVREMRSKVKPDDIATLIYTSGTTGEPKAAELTHSNLDAVVRIHRERLTMLSDNDRSLCFLPLCHIFEKGWTYVCLSQGIHISINQNPKEIARAVRAVRPTCMCSVPRFWEKAYSIIAEKMRERPWLPRIAAKMALRVGRARNIRYARLGKKAPWPIEAAYRFFDKKVLGPVRRAMGIDQGNIFPTAGAPISADIVEFFRSIGVDMVIGYGLSETSATVTCFPDIDYVIGSVGTVMPELEIRIGLQGEIQVKGPTVMRRYYGNPEATEAAFTKDGWFRTGDAGYIDPASSLVLTERLKDLFKTSNGKYIAPQAIESRLGTDKYIEQVAVVGESRKYVTAIIIPAYEALKEYARKKHIAFKDINDLIRNSEIVKMISERIEKLQHGLPSFEQIKKFTLLPKAFTIESGELTNTLKIRRPVIASHYAKEIEAMY